MPTSANANDQATQVNTGGGPAIGHDVNIDKGDFVGRDKIEQHFHYHGASSPVSTSSQEALLFIPFLRKSATEFVGRDAELVELHEKLQQSQMVGVRPAAALTGLGGIGKTQLAVEYAYRYQASYPGGIYWINAADLNRVRSQLVETAERMGLRTDYNTTDNALLAGLVKRCQQQPATLLCFDNAPDAVILWRRLTQELNTATLGAAILITTRRRDLPPTMVALDLRRLSDSTVRQLLGTARPDLLTDPNLPQLLERLGGLPLVVSLVANALQNSPDATIADYLAALAQHGEEVVHEELDARVEDYDLYREVYTRTLLPVLREQWERLCQQPKSENAQLLLRIAGQLPEAAEIPIARLGLLAGLQDEKVIKPLTSAIQTLWKLAFVEELKEDTIRIHPLVHNFAFNLINQLDRYDFCHKCAHKLAVSFEDLLILESNCRMRGIASVIADILTARYFLAVPLALTTYPRSIPSQPDLTDLNLYTLLRILRREMHNLQDNTIINYTDCFLQQYLYCSWIFGKDLLAKQTDRLLISRRKSYFSPIWAVRRESQNLEQTLTNHNFNLHIIAVLDEQRVVSSLKIGDLNIWNWHTGNIEQTLSGHTDKVTAIAVLDVQRIISSSCDRTLNIWNLHTGSIEQTLHGHTERVTSVKLLDKNRVVSASSDRTLKIWNLSTGSIEQTFYGHINRVNSIAVLDEYRIVSVSSDHTIKIWDVQTGQIIQTLHGHTGKVTAVAVLDADGIISASSDRTLKVWNLQTGKVVQTLVGHEGRITAVAVLDAHHIVSSSHDRTLKIWNIYNGENKQTLHGHTGSVTDVTMLDRQRIISASADGTLKIWNMHTDRIDHISSITNFNSHVASVNALALLENYDIVSASVDRTLKIWNLHTGSFKRTLKGHTDTVNAVTELNRQYIVSASSDFKLKIWNIETGVVEQTLIGHKSSVRDVTVLDDERIVSASYDKTLNVWNLHTYSIEQTIQVYRQKLNTVAVLDGQRIVSFSQGGMPKVWHLQADESRQIFHSHTSKRSAVLDNCHTISASLDFVLKILNLETGIVEQKLIGHKADIRSVAVLDANRIVSASYDNTLKVWNLQTGQVIASISLDSAPQCVIVTRQVDRTLVVAGDAGGALYCLELVEPVVRGQ